MTQATDTDIRELKDLITGLREETRVGFAKVETKIATLDGDIRELRAEVKLLDTKFDERTKLGFWGFILRGTVLAIIIGFGGYLLPLVAEYIHKLPSL